MSFTVCLLLALSASHIVEGDYATGPPLSQEELDLARSRPKEVHDPANPPPLDVFGGKRQRSFISLTQTKRWPGGRVPYALSANMTTDQRQVIAAAINQIQDISCITIVPKLSTDTDYMMITAASSATSGCYSLGAGYRPGTGAHFINLNVTGCFYDYIVAHEIFHVLGCLHEQSRPDRSDYLTINWANIANGLQPQFYKLLFEGTSPLPPVCPFTPVAGANYDSCYYGNVVVNDGYPFDYFSVMQYYSSAFTNGNGDTMVSKNPNVSPSQIGGTSISTLDKYKLNAAYPGCAKFVQRTCGGYQGGTSGTINALNGTQTLCQWDIIVDPGYIIELNFNVFNFTNCLDNVVVSENGLSSRTRTYCSTNVPTVTYSSGREVSVRLTRATAANKFFVSWRVLKDKCCQKVTVSASATANINTNPTLKTWLGIYVQNGNTTGNGRFPIYINSNNTNRWLARWDSTFSMPWVMSNFPSVPGGNAGAIFFGPAGTTCPRYVSNSQYYNYPNGPFQIETQPVSLVCATVCTAAPPTAPAGTVRVVPNPANGFSTVIYTCTNSGFKLFSTCQPDATWSTIYGTCPTVTAVAG